MRSRSRPEHARRIVGVGAAGSLALLVVTFTRAATNGPSAERPEDLVFVTEDIAVTRPGCDAVSVASVADGAVLHRGATLVSPGRLASTSDLSLVIAARSNGILVPPNWLRPERYDVYVSRAVGGDAAEREETYLDMDPPVVPLGGLAVTRDDRYLLVATGSIEHARYCGSAAGYPDYLLSKVDLSTLNWDGHLLGPAETSTSLRGTAAEIVMSPDGEIAHVVEVPGDDRGVGLSPRLRSFNVGDLSEAGSPVDLSPIGELPIDCRQPLHWPDRLTHAALTADGRLVTNTWGQGMLNVVDLSARSAHVVEVPGLEKTAGVAVNHAVANNGLLAVHGIDAIGVYSWVDSGTLELLARQSIAPVVALVDGRWRGNTSFGTGPAGSIAWSTDGDRLIAAESYTGTLEFSVWDVSDGGRSLSRRAGIEVCSDLTNYANDILTGNAGLPIATPTATPAVQPVFRLLIPAVPHQPDVPALSRAARVGGQRYRLDGQARTTQSDHQRIRSKASLAGRMSVMYTRGAWRSVSGS